MTRTLSALPRPRVLELLDRMRDTTLLVVGDLMLDRYLDGDVERISPEAPVPVVTVAEERSVPGGAANVAANLVALGATSRLAGVIGDDAAGSALTEALRALGIGVEGVVTVPGRPTTSKTRIVARGQQVVRIDREVTNPLPDPARAALRDRALAALATADALLLEDYDKGALDVDLIAALIAEAGRRGIPVVVDPKLRHFFDYAGATVFKPNRRELETATGTHYSGEDADLDAVRRRLGVDHLLLTLGAGGMALVSPDAPVALTPSIAREVYDVSGAGDTVTAWVAAALAADATLPEAAWLANLAAGVEVGKRGTATVSPHELLAAWEESAG